METKVINLFGNPGAGKSTLASYLFSELKARGKEAELVTDAAKDLVWAEEFNKLENQLYVFGVQLQNLNKLIGKVEYAITDTPLLLHIGYYKERILPAPKQFKKLCVAYAKKYNNINIYLKPNKIVSAIGRAEPDLNPMKYLSTMEFDLKTDCTKQKEVLDFILNNFE